MIVLAQVAVDDLRDSANRYQAGSSSDFLLAAFVFFAALLALLLALQIARYVKASRKPLLLFLDLAEFHNISRKTQKRLIHLARAHGVEDAAFLFSCPGLVERIHSVEVAEARNQAERQRVEEFFRDFSNTVFGDFA